MLLFLCMLLTGLYAEHLGPDCNYDFKNYHWYNAWSFLHQRFDFDMAPAGKATFNNPFLDLINYFLIQTVPKSRLIEFSLGALHGISLYFLLKIALIVFERFPHKWFYAFTAVFIGATGVASLHQVGTTYNESQVSIFVMASLFFLTKAIHLQSERYRDYMLSGLILGIGVAAKLTAYIYMLGIFASLLLFKKTSIKHLKIILTTGIATCIGFFLVDGLWMIKMYQHFQSPFFPYYNNIFHSSFAASTRALEKHYLPANFGQAFLYPFYWLKTNYVTQEFPMKDPRFAVTIVLGLLLLCKQTYNRILSIPPFVSVFPSPAIRFLFLFFCLSFIIWMKQFSIYRYTIPLNFLSGIFIIFFTWHLIWKSHHYIQLIIIILLSALITQQTYVKKWDRGIYRKEFVMIDIPMTPPPEQALVLLMNNALSYLIPSFPTSNRFVGYYNDIARPGNKGLFTSIMDTIQTFHGSIYAIYVEEYSNPKLINKHLSEVNLSIKDCQTLKTNMENAKIKWCSLERI